MKNILKEFKGHCLATKIELGDEKSIKAYNSSTLFCPAGMQQFADYFNKKWLRGTYANNQPCLRVDDIDEIGDGTHLAYFNMLGLFSFREMSMKNAMDWWVSFIEEKLELKIDKVTVHPDRIREWLPFVNEYLRVETDNDCTWTDGNTFGYCMEFYIDGIEIGNIVNTGGDCIDAGFGLERLDSICNGTIYSAEKVLTDSILKIIDSGVEPSPSKQGYVLRKLLNKAVKEAVKINHPYYKQEEERIAKIDKFYEENKSKYKGKSEKWWKETHGVELPVEKKLG